MAPAPRRFASTLLRTLVLAYGLWLLTPTAVAVAASLDPQFATIEMSGVGRRRTLLRCVREMTGCREACPVQILIQAPTPTAPVA